MCQKRKGKLMKKKAILFLLFISLISISLGAKEIVKVNYDGFISQMKIYKGYYYFFDNKAGSVYRYDQKGEYIKVFGKYGEGPGELTEYLGFDFIDNKIYLQSQAKIIFFDLNGKLFTEKKKVRPSYFLLLENKNMIELFVEKDYNTKLNLTNHKVFLCDAEFKRIKCLLTDSEKRSQGSPFKSFIDNIEVKYSESSKSILISQRRKGFLFNAFDLNGNLIFSIRNEKIPKIKVSNAFLHDFKEKLFSDPRMRSNIEMAEQLYKQIQFPEYFPPFHSFYYDDLGNIFIRTYERKGVYLLYKNYSSRGEFLKNYWLKDNNADIYETRNFISFYKNRFVYLYESEEDDYILSKQELSIEGAAGTVH